MIPRSASCKVLFLNIFSTTLVEQHHTSRTATHLVLALLKTSKIPSNYFLSAEICKLAIFGLESDEKFDYSGKYSFFTVVAIALLRRSSFLYCAVDYSICKRLSKHLIVEPVNRSFWTSTTIPLACMQTSVLSLQLKFIRFSSVKIRYALFSRHFGSQIYQIHNQEKASGSQIISALKAPRAFSPIISQGKTEFLETGCTFHISNYKVSRNYMWAESP